ncbi:hypothetical protein GobsT_50860 [Gemmata obscuriglobus]|nr:hypothetical protein GobsT_50860 [Gemmata obscuriglobus]VTS09606.1 unnamed protein product [Gemmata obscuriglobus UQM 2246]
MAGRENVHIHRAPPRATRCVDLVNGLVMDCVFHSSPKREVTIPVAGR